MEAENVTEDQAGQWQNLTEAVMQQQQQIQGLVQVLQQSQPAPRSSNPRHQAPAGGNPRTNVESEIEEWEAEFSQVELEVSSITSSVKGTGKSPINAGALVLSTGVPSTTELSPVLVNWGNKQITFGRKHLRKTYSQVYCQDYQYVEWIRARAQMHTPAMKDFLSYTRARDAQE